MRMGLGLGGWEWSEGLKAGAGGWWWTVDDD